MTRKNMGRWLRWALGAAALLAIGLAGADPAIWFLILDPELLALIVAVTVALTRSAIADALLYLRAMGCGRRSSRF
jgi:hypothetical protein